MKLSLNQAAKEAGKSKKTLIDALKSGKLSGEKVNGKWEIDPSELFRAFPRETSLEPVTETETHPPLETGKDKEIEMLRELLEAKDQHIESVERQIGVLNQKLLAAPHQEDRKGLLKRLFG